MRKFQDYVLESLRETGHCDILAPGPFDALSLAEKQKIYEQQAAAWKEHDGPEPG